MSAVAVRLKDVGWHSELLGVGHARKWPSFYSCREILSSVYHSLQQYCLIKALSSYMKVLEKGGNILSCEDSRVYSGHLTFHWCYCTVIYITNGFYVYIQIIHVILVLVIFICLYIRHRFLVGQLGGILHKVIPFFLLNEHKHHSNFFQNEGMSRHTALCFLWIKSSHTDRCCTSTDRQ